LIGGLGDQIHHAQSTPAFGVEKVAQTVQLESDRFRGKRTLNWHI
jgi:hypothetical protein